MAWTMQEKNVFSRVSTQRALDEPFLGNLPLKYEVRVGGTDMAKLKHACGL